MNANIFPRRKLLRSALVALALPMALPAVAQQNGMQGMDMQMALPAKAASSPAPASSSQSMQGTSMSSMPDMPTQKPANKPKKTKQHHHHAAAPAAASSAHTMEDMDTSSMPGMQMAAPAQAHAAPAVASFAQSMQGMDMQGMDMSSKKEMTMPGMQPVPMRPSQPVAAQPLHFGNMIGVRPKPRDLSGMETMEMSSMQGGNAPPDARDTDYSDGYRYGPMRGMDMADDDAQGMVLFDQLEFARSNHGGDGAFMEGKAWYGKDFDKLWLKVEGDSSDGKLMDLRTEALWAHAVAAFWDTQLGVRHDFGDGPGRTWAAFGVEGMAPYWLDTEATLYVGQDGRTAARVMVEYEEPITQRLILQPMFEANAYGKDDPQRGIGSGLSDADLDLRLRYEISRQFAPYVGVVWRQRFGRTSDFAHAQGEHAGELQFVAGLHFWF